MDLAVIAIPVVKVVIRTVINRSYCSIKSWKKQQTNQAEASTNYEAPTLEVVEVKIPQGFDPSGERGNDDDDDDD
jgi:hypothetical protein